MQQETPAYLLSSSHIFNQKRLELARANEALEKSRKRRLFDGLHEDVSGETEFGGEGQGEGQGKVVEVLRKEQEKIGKYIAELVGLRSQLRAFERERGREIDEEDERFLVEVLMQHGYLDKEKAHLKLNQVFKQARSKFSNGSTPQNSPQKSSASNLEAPLLQNLRSSKLPLAHQLCSIAYKPSLQQSSQPQNLSLSGSKSGKKSREEGNKCSLQLDFDLVHQEDQRKEKGIKEITQMRLGRISKRYIEAEEDNQGSGGFGDCEEESQESSGSGPSSHKENASTRANRKAQKQLSHMFSKIQLPDHPPNRKKSPKPNPNAPTSRPQKLNFLSSQKQSILITEATSNALIGKIGPLKVQIHFSSIEKLVARQEGISIRVKGLGSVSIVFQDCELSEDFFMLLGTYFGGQQEDW